MPNLFWLIIFFTLNLTGCATESSVTMPLVPQSMPGFYHHVVKGETLWRISKAYGIDLDNLASINRISDATKIEVGQMVFIPRKQKQPVIATPQKPAITAEDDFVWPVKGRVIATFNQTIDNLIEKGIDIRPNEDSTVVASRSGKIVFLSPNFKRYGKTIIIDHRDGFLTVYAKIEEALAKIGENVKQGDAIARAKILHFEIRKGHLSKNPLFYLP